MTVRAFLHLLVFLFLNLPFIFAQDVKGIWVECEGSNNTLSSQQKLQELIRVCRDTSINNIFLQVYRHNRSWYNSTLADTTPYKNCGFDPLEYVVTEAHRYNIKVHAWLNVFRIGKDLNVPIIKKLGKDIIVVDGRGRSLLAYPLDKLPDGGYWIDPGDVNARRYLLSIVEELLQKYPQLDGIHLDYIRYPYTDLTPGSQFSKRRDFGYSKVSMERFKAKYGFSPLGMDLTDRERTLQWDNWRREQITEFVRDVYKLTKGKNPRIKVSCAVQPWTDRAYMVSYQDWPNWLRSGIVDFVVLMNYSTDTKLVKYLSEMAMTFSKDPTPYIGLGAYLLVNSPVKLYQQIKQCQELGVKGIVLFSYDALLKNKDIFKEIARNKWWTG